MNTVELRWSDIAPVRAAQQARARRAARREWLHAAGLLLFLAACIALATGCSP